VHQRSNDYQRNGRLQRTPMNAKVRVQCAQKSEQPSEAHRTVNSTYPVPLEDKAPTVVCARTLTVGRRGWRTGLSGAPIDNSHPQRLFWLLRAINTPNHLHSNDPSIPHITFNTREIDFTPRHKSSDRSTQSPEFNSSALGLVRGSLVFLVALVCLVGFLFFSSYSQVFCKQGKRHQLCGDPCGV
jgi:hypothetical protein